MAKTDYPIHSIKEANGVIEESHEAINQNLTDAKVTSIEVNGRPMPATSEKVPLPSKIRAAWGAVKPGAADQEKADLLASNQLLADRATDLQTRLAAAESNLSTSISRISVLEADLATNKNSVATLTSQLTEVTNLRDAAVKEGARVTGLLNVENAGLSADCLSIGCLSDLKDSAGNILSSTATAAEKQAAAERIEMKEKRASMKGAANSALARLGVPISQIPAGGLSQTATSGRDAGGKITNYTQASQSAKLSAARS